jgi:hypothetical protein
MRNLVKIICLFWLFVFTLAACFDYGNEIAFQVSLQDKSPPKSNSVVRVAAYIEPSPESRDALESVFRYSVVPQRNGVKMPYFDYVIVSGGTIKQGKVTAYLDLSRELQNFFENNGPLFKSVRGRGIKVLLGVTGGGDGITFGCLPGRTEQEFFAKQVVDACRYYELDGVEFWDKDGSGSGRNPYPESTGMEFFNGEEFFFIL